MRRQPRPRHRLASVAALAVAATLVLAGCGGNSDDDGTTDTTATTPTGTTTSTSGGIVPSVTVTTGPATSTEPSSPRTTEPTTSAPSTTTHDTSRGSRAKASQIAKDDLPGFNDQWTWDLARGHRGPPPSSPGRSQCMRSSMTAIGGVTEYSTAYRNSGAPEDEAVLTTAVFPDEHTAQLAESVLSSWLRTCAQYVAQQPGVTRVKVTDDRTVSTSVGTGHQRLISYGPVQGDPDSTYFNGEGYVRDGDVISYLVFHSIGQDYNYEAGKEPVDLGLAVAADYLERSR